MEEAVERGGLVFQILFVYLCCVVRAPGHWWKKEPLKKSELGKGRSGRTRTSAVLFQVVFSLRPNPWRSCITFLLHCITR